jgi:hypothetical protein
MEILKKYIVGIVLLVVVGIIWAGFALLADKIFLDVNPNASTYTKPLEKNFDVETLNKVSERTEKSFPILPSEFFSLNED